jgi:hypothetical protein
MTSNRSSKEVRLKYIERVPGRLILFRNMLHGATNHECSKHSTVALYPAYGHIIGNQTTLANNAGNIFP